MMKARVLGYFVIQSSGYRSAFIVVKRNAQIRQIVLVELAPTRAAKPQRSEACARPRQFRIA